MKNIMRWRVKTCTVCVLTEEAALCAPLPCPECDTRGDNEHVRSRRQVQKINTLCTILYPKRFNFLTFNHNMRSPSSLCSLAGAIMAGILQQRDTDSCVRMGLLAARLSLVSQHPIAPTLTLDSVDPRKFQPEDWPKPKLMLLD